jgi:hypothetical protein
VKRLTIVLAGMGVLLPAPVDTAGAQNTAAIEAWNTPCLQEYAAWKQKPRRKAVAVTVPNSNGQGCGFSWSGSTKADARAEALRQCRLRKRQEDPKSKDTCRISQIQ